MSFFSDLRSVLKNEFMSADVVSFFSDFKSVLKKWHNVGDDAGVISYWELFEKLPELKIRSWKMIISS
jgi:hypothetical protein